MTIELFFMAMMGIITIVASVSMVSLVLIENQKKEFMAKSVIKKKEKIKKEDPKPEPQKEDYLSTDLIDEEKVPQL